MMSEAASLNKEMEADRVARERIVSELDTNFLVEAGAGSGKTTALVERMVAHVLDNRPVECLAAVTFTRKAASELSERFREQLENKKRSAQEDGVEREANVLERALDQIDECFIGTIHAFCARLLRERPLEAGLDPSFVEITEDDWLALCDDYWRNWVQRRTDEEDAGIAQLRSLGIEPFDLAETFRVVVENQDVDFPFAESAEPDIVAARTRLRALLARAGALRPTEEPAAGWDELQKLTRRLSYLEKVTSQFKSIRDFCDAIGSITRTKVTVTQNRWSDSKEGKAEARSLCEDFKQFFDAELTPLITRWYEYRYAPIMRVLMLAGDEFEKYRIASACLGFGDLLSRAAYMLANDDRSRKELGDRFRYLLVDEFQDTDPLQAEVCFLLASDPSEGKDWKAVKPRGGALFVVGDPKQSIYRFRRADIETYDLVKKRMAELGAVVQLTRNFRSTTEIGEFVNKHFINVFPNEASESQAPYSPLLTEKRSGKQAVFAYAVNAGNKDDIYDDDASRVASWVASRLANEPDRKPEDFLILSWRREPVLAIARALAERNVPALATGANVGVEEEVEELLVVLRALADPANSVNVVAAIQGMFIGGSPADIFDAHVAGIEFSLLADPGAKTGIVADGIRLLRKWHALSLVTPADSLIDTLLDETGLLALTAGEEIGDTRAGMLLRIVSMLRASVTESTGSMSDAIQRIENMLVNDIEGEPTLRPGRGDAVRVMNLHQAKGLEAEIVVLASPYKPTKSPPVELHVKRADSSRPTGWMKITVPESKWTEQRKVAAQAPGWDEKEAIETAYLEAEHERLRYVAATRAKSELWISQLVGDPKTNGQWECFTNSLPSPKLAELKITVAPGRLKLAETVEDISTRIMDAESRRAAAREPSYAIRSVTKSAKETLIARAEGEGNADENRATNAKGRGKAWGRAVHRVIEAMGLGREGETLAQFASAVVADELELSSDDKIDEATKSVLALVSRLRTDPEWQTLMQCTERYFELPLTTMSTELGIPTVTEGVIDAAGFDGNRWHVYDWKTDQCDDTEWSQRVGVYQAQVDAYVNILAGLYGQAAYGKIVRVTMPV